MASVLARMPSALAKSHLAGIHDDDGKLQGGQGGDQGRFVAAGSLDNDVGQLRLLLEELGDLLMPDRGIGKRLDVRLGGEGEVEGVFGDINAGRDDEWGRQEWTLPCDAGLPLAAAQATVRVRLIKTGRDQAHPRRLSPEGIRSRDRRFVGDGFVRCSLRRPNKAT